MRIKHLWRTNWMYIILLLTHIAFLFVIDGLVLSGSDEEVYLKTFENLVDSDKSKFSLNGWSFENPLLIALILAPARVFHGLGFEALLSLRLNSLVYLAGTIAILDRAFARVFFSHTKKQIYVTLVFCIPSVFFFGSLGGREALLGFYLVLSIYLAREYITTRRFVTLVYFSLASVGLFVSKPHYLVVVLTSLILMVFVRANKVVEFRKSTIELVVCVLLVGTCLPGSFQHNLRSFQSLSGIMDNSDGTSASQSDGTSASQSDGTSASQTVQFNVLQHGNLYELRDLIRKNSLAATVFSAAGVTDKIDEKISQGYNADVSKNRAQKTELDTRFDRNPFVNIRSLFLFLLKPIPFTDNGSFLLNFFSLEFPVWLFLYFLLFRRMYWSLGRGSITSQNFILPSSAMMILSLITFFADTNIQVALRHRYPIGLLILLVVAFVGPKVDKSQAKH